MKPSELRTTLAATIPAGDPVLITGAPGLGKSDIVAKATADAGADLILSHPAVADPTDVRGLPWMSEGAATFLPFGELAQAIRATRPTVWFLDDLGQATPAVQASYMQLLLARRVNGHALPDCITFIAATNRRVDRAGVSGVLEPVKSRFVTIVELKADLQEWSEWAIDHNQRAEVIAYLRFQQDAFSAFVATADLVNSPSPRTWSHVSRILNLNLPAHVQSEVINGAVGEGAGTGFNAFLRMYRELPNVDAILLSPDTAIVPDSPSALYAVAGALAARATTATFAPIVTYANRLLQAARGEFGILMIRDSVRRCPDVQHTQAFARMAIGDLGKLYTGAL
jgi:MoxR-like ATPase